LFSKLYGQAIDAWQRQETEREQTLGDFTTTYRVIPLSAIAVAIGCLATFVAWALLRLIGFFTNLLYYGRMSVRMVSPAENHLGIWAVFIPVLGALVIGLMARFGSERIRGHGIPEAIESILINGSRVEPKLAILKPLSSAISIGSGGPFGAEGPIIMTGGAFGSMIAQFFHLTSVERKTLLVAGAAAGMSATFNAPLSAVLLAVELLLFEWKPRSVIPVALASATAAAARFYVLGGGALFPVPAHPAFAGAAALSACLVAGLAAGVLSVLLTAAVYLAEDSFQRLPIHWMWWPPVGGLIVGLGGLIFPQALGVGYDTIAALLQGEVPRNIILGILLVKSLIWAVSLGSGTSGGVLAPLLMMGGALGGLEAGVFAHIGVTGLGIGFWPLVSLGAILGGTMRSPFTGILFALELTRDVNMLLPLVIASFAAHAFTVLVLRRSILTEKVSRRGYHLSREYAVDPLETLLVQDVMRTRLVAFSPANSFEEIQRALHQSHGPHGQQIYPILGADRTLRGAIARADLLKAQDGIDWTNLAEMPCRSDAMAHPEESLRAIVYRMAGSGITRFLVTDRETKSKLLGLVCLEDLLHARTRSLQEESARERVLRIRYVR
jgi:H+/Cl- antiporter ClcA/CBS domain-containing protein